MLYKKLLSAYSFCIMMTQYAICVWLQVLYNMLAWIN